MDPIKALYEAIQKRPRPEDVAQLILEVGELSPADRKKIEPAARNSLKRATYAYTSMSQDFARLYGADKVVARSAQIFEIPDPPSAVECLDVLMVEAFMNRAAKSINVDPSQDIRGQRLAKKERREQGIFHKRAYNRKFRAIHRLQQRIERMVRTGKLYTAMKIAKSAGATRITEDLLRRDLPTACFVAYLTARMNLRSTFTNTSQVRAFDTIASALYEMAKRSPTVCWEAIACVHPEGEVLKHLTDEEKGRLLGDWTEILHRLADFLQEIYRENSLDLHRMVVRRGNDSSSWNAAAGAWNKARDHWFSLVYALGLESIITHYCPGKVLRLMAADVVSWHSWGKSDPDAGLHPATLVWRDLPFPWAVFQQRDTCTMDEVIEACKRHNQPIVGWVTPPPSKRPAAFTPTPELVHGVACSSPFLAATLRSAGWFSGKETSPVDVPVEVLRDASGSAIGAVDLNSIRAQGGVEHQ
jgi:hypothetical protein